MEKEPWKESGFLSNHASETPVRIIIAASGRSAPFQVTDFRLPLP